MTEAVGTHLGTTNSVVSMMRVVKPIVIVNSEKIKNGLFKVVAAPNDAVHRDLMGKQHSPAERSALVPPKLADDAARYVGEKVHDAAITFPSYFNDAQRQANKSAVRIAGPNVLRIINEPTAASLAYGLGKRTTKRFWSSILTVEPSTYRSSMSVIPSQVTETQESRDLGKRYLEWISIN